jgi:hypothetical protein
MSRPARTRDAQQFQVQNGNGTSKLVNPNSSDLLPLRRWDEARSELERLRSASKPFEASVRPVEGREAGHRR